MVNSTMVSTNEIAMHLTYALVRKYERMLKESQGGGVRGHGQFNHASCRDSPPWMVEKYFPTG
jgi:hypothetical protein